MAKDVKGKVSDAYARSKAKASSAVEASKDKAARAAKATAETARKAKQATADGVDRNPLSAVIGGLAVGMIVAAMLPRTKRENKIAGKVGKNIRTRAGDAAKAAGSSARETLDSLGVNKDAAKNQIRDLAGKLGEAAKVAGKSAAETARKS